VKAFARKIIRIGGQIQKADIENEAQIVSLILAHGGHGNIVTVFTHDWLKFSFNQCYYIDMELCDFNLHDYINHNDSLSSSIGSLDLSLAPAIVSNDCSTVERLRNYFTIVTHIARGLEFLHTYKVVHRDLKPRNGTFSHYIVSDELVLYRRADNRWKLTDFGVSAQLATTRKALTTKYSRGTTSYRAPELLTEHAVFTNLVDIWGLGCIMYELVTGLVAFPTDWSVVEHCYEERDLSVSLPTLPAFCQEHISGMVNTMLRKDWNERPSAADVCIIAIGYSRLLELPTANVIIQAPRYPSFREWWELMQKNFNKQELFVQVANLYDQRGEVEIGTDIRKALEIPRVSNAERLVNVADTGSGEPDQSQTLPFWEAMIEIDPPNFWSWYGLCSAHVRAGNVRTAIAVCHEGTTRYPRIPWPVVLKTSLHAMENEYGLAINTYTNYFLERKEEETELIGSVLAQQQLPVEPSFLQQLRR
jgi:serine/threonine protein kinase